MKIFFVKCDKGLNLTLLLIFLLLAARGRIFFPDQLFFKRKEKIPGINPIKKFCLKKTKLDLNFLTDLI